MGKNFRMLWLMTLHCIIERIVDDRWVEKIYIAVHSRRYKEER